jgi:hypothetical protein
VAYTKAVRAAALPWNQRREQRAAESTSKLDRPAACLNGSPINPERHSLQKWSAVFLKPQFRSWKKL